MSILRNSWNTKDNIPNSTLCIGKYLFSECDKELQNHEMEAKLVSDIWALEVS